MGSAQHRAWAMLSPSQRVNLPPEPLYPWLATYFAASMFFSGASFKFMGLEVETAFFSACGLPPWMIQLVGYGEVLIGLLLIPRVTTTIGAIAGMALMGGAFASVIQTGWWFLLPLPITTTAGLLYAGWHRRDAMVAWLQQSLPDAASPSSRVQEAALGSPVMGGSRS